MNEEMTDNLMQCLEVNDGIKGDVVDDYVHNLTFIFTTADTTVIPQDDLQTYHKYNRLVSYRHTFYSTSYLHNNMHPEGTRVGVGIFGIIIPTVFFEDILLEVGTIHKGYEQRLNQPEVKEPEEVDLGQTPEITEFHYKGNEDD
ncbi:hypothetical protein SAMN05216462_1657 [Xylanibacter ruminicola]|uniref:Uncharacterized protein n=1 Tax=Xylanibacter ruminicola TaxID=839 RepID=A0A1H4BX01_XYLRU|nr:hypothetical protein [Xylanibacter ruminicola]SEA52668.1 hypothetical protein SAMN05216462_1657 [Xylanibacter ruminicola]